MKKTITEADLEGVLEFACKAGYLIKTAQEETSSGDIAYAYLKSLPKEEPKMTYVLYGSEAVRTLLNEGIFAISEAIRGS